MSVCTRDNIQKTLKNKAMPKIEMSDKAIGYVREVIKRELEEVEKSVELYAAENDIHWHKFSTENAELLKSVLNALDNPK